MYLDESILCASYILGNGYYHFKYLCKSGIPLVVAIETKLRNRYDIKVKNDERIALSHIVSDFKAIQYNRNHSRRHAEFEMN